MAIPTAQGGLTTSPKQAAGESDAAFQARLQAWMAGGSGVTLGGTGIPTPVYRAAGDFVSPSGAVLGAFPVENADALPAPTRMGPFGRSDAGLIELDDPSLGRGPFLPAPVDAWGRSSGPGRLRPSNGPVFRGPIGAPPTSLREPADPTPYDLERETALLATGYDPSWGTPPDRLGLAWDPVRFLYEPTNDRDGLPYAFAARDARYLQAFQRPDGTWGERWVLALAPTPDRDRPYRGLDRAESSRLDAEVARMRRAERSYDARWKRGEVTRYEHPAIEFTPRYGPAKQAPKLSDFAWVGWRQLPVGCPYPYPAMPVPIADYTSGRWLDEDYVPSIPLPSPYDQVRWRCGVPKQPGKPHKGGGGSPSEETTFPKQHSDLAAGAGSGASASSVLLDVGMPPPGGDIFLNRSPEDAPAPPPVPVDPPKKPCRILIVVLMGGDPTARDGERNNDAFRAKEPVFISAVDSRVSFYTDLGCTVTLAFYSDASRLLCDLAKKVLRGESAGEFLNVEVYSHGNPSGPVTHGTSPRELLATFRDIGTLLGALMTRGADGQGYILLGWCDACAASTGTAERLGPTVAGASGHEVVGPSGKIIFSSPSDVRRDPVGGFLQPYPEILPAESHFIVVSDEDGVARPKFMSATQAARTPGAIENSGWISYPPEVFDHRGTLVPNPGDDGASLVPIVRPSRRDASGAIEGSIPSVGIEHGTIPFNPVQGKGGSDSAQHLRETDPLSNSAYVSASMQALRRPSRKPRLQSGSSSARDEVARQALARACYR